MSRRATPLTSWCVSRATPPTSRCTSRRATPPTSRVRAGSRGLWQRTVATTVPAHWSILSITCSMTALTAGRAIVTFDPRAGRAVGAIDLRATWGGQPVPSTDSQDEQSVSPKGGQNGRPVPSTGGARTGSGCTQWQSRRMGGWCRQRTASAALRTARAPAAAKRKTTGPRRGLPRCGATLGRNACGSKIGVNQDSLGALGREGAGSLGGGKERARAAARTGARRY